MGLPAPSAPSMRSLYVYENKGIQALSVVDRVVYQYENKGVWAHPVLERTLYEYENRAIQALVAIARTLYDYENLANGALFPWLMKLEPGRQFPGGQVSIYGDGFGATQAADGSTVYLIAEAMGVVSWQNRSPGLWPSNTGAAILPALVVTVPADGVSGMVKVEETIP